MVYVNSVINLAYNRYGAFKQIFKVLKPGGLFICEAVVADAPRDQEVLEAARALGNSIQAATSKGAFETQLSDIGFEKPQYSDAHDVLPNQGFKAGYEVKIAPSTEDVRFVACVAHVRKPRG